MIRHETQYYDNFVMKTFTEYTDGVVTLVEKFDTKGQLVKRIKGDLIENFEYSRNRLRRYSNNKGDWKRYTYQGDKTFVLESDSKNKTITKTQIVKEVDEIIKVIHTIPKRMKWVRTSIQI